MCNLYFNEVSSYFYQGYQQQTTGAYGSYDQNQQQQQSQGYGQPDQTGGYTQQNYSQSRPITTFL